MIKLSNCVLIYGNGLFICQSCYDGIQIAVVSGNMHPMESLFVSHYHVPGDIVII